MTRGRAGNTAHLVAETLEDAKQQWIDAFARNRSDLGLARARDAAPRTSDGIGNPARCGLKRPHRPGNDGTESGNNSKPRDTTGRAAGPPIGR